MKKIILTFVALALIAPLLYAAERQIDLSMIQNGVYDGSYESNGVVYNVEVGVLDGKIDFINVLNTQPNQYAIDAEAVTEKIISEQSLSVDAVTGATISSTAIISAVKDALNNAALKEDLTSERSEE